MKLEGRSFSGKLFRPRPEILCEAGGEVIVVASPWGPRNLAEKSLKLIQDHVLASRNDAEITSPFEKLTCLSPLANNLRIATKLANDKIYNEDNKNEYRGGLELFAGARYKREFAWVQVGQPHILLSRPGQNLMPLSIEPDFTFQLGSSQSPLPSKLLGLDSTSDFQVRQMALRPGDKFVFISRSSLPAKLFSIAASDITLDHLSRLFAADHSDQPFWLGLLEFDDVA